MGKVKWLVKRFKKEYVILVAIAIIMILVSIPLKEVMDPYIRGIDLGQYGYLGIFLLGMIVNATVLIPVPTMLPVLASLTSEFNIFWIAFLYAAGATIGEGTSYWGIRFGDWFGKWFGKWFRWLRKKTKQQNNHLAEATMKYTGVTMGLTEVKKVQDKISRTAGSKIEGWMKKYGGWAIFVLAFQPFLPFDAAGLVAGATKYPYWKFCFFCFLGRVPKYLIGISLLLIGVAIFT